MNYTLKEEIRISRNIVFLCGPYYQKDNKSDRRNIMRDTFRKYYKSGILPLIIDNIFNQENFNDENINIQLLEEIFAAISLKTYVFLDTMSASAEMGLFSNHAFKNHLVVYLPYQSDTLNKGLVGAFIRDGIFKGKGACVKVLEYRPQITRSAIASDYVVEHYGFINDIIPENIERDIKEDKDLHIDLCHKLKVLSASNFPDNFYEIAYYLAGNTLKINSSVKLLFIVTTSIMYEFYGKVLKMDKTITIDDFDLNRIEKEVREAYAHFVYKKAGIYSENVSINTILKAPYEDVIYHIVTFIYMYHCRSTYCGYKLLGAGRSNVIEYCGAHPFKVFGVNELEVECLVNAVENPNLYYEKSIIKRNGKKRELIKYADSTEGKAVRKVHEKIAEKLEKEYHQHNSSYAYRKGYSIKNCVEQHLTSNGFVKCDISKFFNNIDFENLVKCIGNVFQLDKDYKQITEQIVKGFFVEGELPLGLVASPILSDIYMHDFDREMEAFAKKYQYVYTRYADDIMLSSDCKIDKKEEDILLRFIENKIRKKKLKLNKKKTQNTYLENTGQNMRYVGVNIVKGETNNYLSVGKKYIYDVAKEYLDYLDIEDETTRFYEERRIAGKVAFIRQIEGEEGWKRLKMRLNNDQEYVIGEKLRFDQK